MLIILRAGIYTTVQDLGREGFRRLGISTGGALDQPALKIANLLVGNAPEAAGLEITLGQFSAEFTRPGWIALTGAGCDAQLDGKPLWTGWRYPVKKGQRLVLGTPKRGMRSYLAIAGGIAVPEMLGSRSTDMKAAFGGCEGRNLRDGDRLPLGQSAAEPQTRCGVKQLLFTNRIRALPGPEYAEFSEEAQDTFWRAAWQLSPQSNRMGYRLHGGTPLARTTERDAVARSDAWCGAGAAQRPADRADGRCANHRRLPAHRLRDRSRSLPFGADPSRRTDPFRSLFTGRGAARQGRAGSFPSTDCLGVT